MKEQKKIEVKRSEQIRDIVDRMPTKGTKWVLCIVLGLVSALLFFGFIIRYPEVVSGSITVTTDRAPIVLVSKSPGRLQLLGSHPRIPVNEGQVFAVLHSATLLTDLLRADSLLNRLGNGICPDGSVVFPGNLNLGELNGTYYSFLGSYERLLRYGEENTFNTRERSARLQLEGCGRALESGRERLKIKEEQLAFFGREIVRDSLLKKIGSFVERDVDRTRNNYNSMLEGCRTLEESLASLQMQMESLNNQLNQIRIERREKEQEMRTQYMGALNALHSEIVLWKERYAFVAPFDGVVEFLGFWQENVFVSSGKELFSVIPQGGTVYGHMQLPSKGAGKVKTGQTVTIQLNDYPHLEFGSIEGRVSSISLIANPVPVSGSAPVDTYLLTVALPDGLKTKFGTLLGFRHEIKGSADIQTRKRRLIERLFDNLKYMTQD